MTKVDTKNRFSVHNELLLTRDGEQGTPRIYTHQKNPISPPPQAEHSEGSVSSSNGDANQSQWQDRLLDSRDSNSLFAYRSIKVHSEDFQRFTRATFLKEAVQQVCLRA